MLLNGVVVVERKRAVFDGDWCIWDCTPSIPVLKNDIVTIGNTGSFNLKGRFYKKRKY